MKNNTLINVIGTRISGARPLRRWSQLALLGAAVLSAPHLAEAKSRTVKVPKAAVSSAMNVALASVKVKLHNGNSYLLLPNGNRKPLKVDEHSHNLTKTRKLVARVNDMNSSRVSGYVDGKRIGAAIAFESAGEEVKVSCYKRRRRRWKDCSLNMERDVHLDNASVDLSFVPKVSNKTLSLDAPKVKFRTDVRIANRLCKAFKGICSKIEGRIKNEMRKSLEASIQRELSTKKFRLDFSRALRRANPLRRYISPKAEITNIRSSGKNFLVTIDT